MTISCTDRGTAASNASSSTTYAFSPASNFAAGSTAVICISADNSVSGGATNNINSVTDSLGNTWFFAQKPIFDNGAASAGIQGAIAWTTMGKGTLTTSDTITITFGNATTAKSYTLHEVVPTSGKIATYKTGGVGSGTSVTATGTYSMTTGSVAVGDLLICTLAMESGTGQGYTADSDTTNGTWSTVQYSEVGTTLTGNCIGSQYKVQTTTASTQSYDATLAEAADSKGAWAVFTEVDPVILREAPNPDYQRTSKRQGGFIEYGQALLLTTLAVAGSGDLIARAPLYTPIKTQHRLHIDVFPNLLMTTLAGSGNVTVGLTGEAVTVSAGTLGVDSSVALSGQSATSTAGTLAPEISVPLSGEAVTASAGTLTPDAVSIPFKNPIWPDQRRTGRTQQPEQQPSLLLTTLQQVGTVALGGQAVTTSAGTLGVATDVALTGEAAGVSAGTLAAAVDAALAGESVTGSAGTLAPSITVALTGQEVTVTAGNLTADAGISYIARDPLFTNVRTKGRTQQPDDPINLLGTTLGQVGTVQLGGAAVTTSAGTLTPDISVALTGAEVTVSAGTLSAQIDLAPFKTPLWPEYRRIRTRQIDLFPNLLESTLAPAYELNARIDWGNPDRAIRRKQTIDYQNLLMTTLSNESTAGITGESVTTSAGTLAPSVSVALTGSAVTVSAGTLTASPAAALAGEAVTTAAGTLSVATSVSLSGDQVGTFSGTLTPFATGDVTVALTGETVTCYAGTLTPSGGTVASTRPPGGSGYPVDWQGKRRKARLVERPNLHLQAILDDVVRELYGELTEDDVPAEVQKQAAKLVKPYAEKKAKKLAVPPESAVDWTSLEKDAARVKRIIALWREQETRREIDDDDEFMLLID